MWPGCKVVLYGSNREWYKDAAGGYIGAPNYLGTSDRAHFTVPALSYGNAQFTIYYTAGRRSFGWSYCTGWIVNTFREDGYPTVLMDFNVGE